MKNEYFKRTTKKLVGTDELLKEIAKGKKYTHYMLKYDGIHAELIIGETETKFITRSGQDVSHLIPYLVKGIDSLGHREAIRGVYACELVHIAEVKTNPRNSWSKAMQVLGSDNYRPELDRINCVIYDVHEMEYKEINPRSYVQRRLTIPMKIPEGFDIAPCLEIDGIADDWQFAIIDNKCEGFVLFNVNAEVDWSKTFTKIKPKIEGDVIVTKINEGTKGTKNEGKCGSLAISVYKQGKFHSLGNASGMTQDERDYWTNELLAGYNRISLFNLKIIQVEASELTQDGKLRFANYIRLREDKVYSECNYEQFT